MRPELPLLTPQWAPMLAEVIRTCWQWNPSNRPSFAEVLQSIQHIRLSVGGNFADSPHLSHYRPVPLDERKSPDMRPIPLPPRECGIERFSTWRLIVHLRS